MHLVKCYVFAKQAWEALQNEYQPTNSMRATWLKQTILTYLPAPGYDTVKWQDNMLCMFNELTDVDPTAMSDHEFA